MDNGYYHCGNSGMGFQPRRLFEHLSGKYAPGWNGGYPDTWNDSDKV